MQGTQRRVFPQFTRGKLRKPRRSAPKKRTEEVRIKATIYRKSIISYPLYFTASKVKSALFTLFKGVILSILIVIVSP